ncbi:hypothetical protein ACT3CE_11055 [Marinifilum sp. RC60d5]|uniref:hypothetical protein n=1 Tax=Marinifilum sp. RC60d5 TaxID=3458414 RepID=UPI0040375ECD
MKNIKYLFVFSLLALFFACDDDYEALNDLADVDWYTSGFRTAKQLNIEDYMSFSDLSQGAVEHSWSFADTSGCKFLTGIITRQDSTYYPFIDENAGNTSLDETVSVLFTKPGLQGIRLKNTFSKYVEFIGTDTLAAVKQGDVWVIDTTFMVDVFDTIQSAFKVYHKDVEIASVASDQQSVLADTASWPEYEIMSGEVLKFVDLSELGRPNTSAWALNGGSPSSSSDSVAMINYYRLGTFYAKHTSSRSGENIPGANKMKYIPLKIKVIKSTLPFEVTGTIKEQKDETLQISVTGELKKFAEKEGFFTVHVSNSKSGFDQDIAVASAMVNANQGNIIDLKLAEPIYNEDVVTVTYAGGDIKSVDDRTLEDFTTLPVKMYILNLIPNGGFEDGGSGWIVGTEKPDQDVALSEYSTTDPAEGNYCYHMLVTADEYADGLRSSVMNTGSFNLVPGKKYVYKFKYKTISKLKGGYEPRLFYYDNGAYTRLWGAWSNYNPANGEWTQASKVYTFTKASAKNISINVLSYVESEIYFDDFWLYEQEVRP